MKDKYAKLGELHQKKNRTKTNSGVVFMKLMIKIYIVHGVLYSTTYTFTRLSSLPYSTSYLLPNTKENENQRVSVNQLMTDLNSYELKKYFFILGSLSSLETLFKILLNFLEPN